MQPIYFVDDDSEDLAFVKSAFEKLYSEVLLKTFSNGRELISALNKHETLPSFILMDLNMPVMHGIEALTIIRNTKEISHLNVVMFSTSNNPKERQASMQAGANDYICKPFSIAEYEKIAVQLYSRFNLNDGNELHIPSNPNHRVFE